MTTTADQAWAALTTPWKTVFDLAWKSWCEGNYGIGAALVDPETNEIVSVGRNQINHHDPEPDPTKPPALGGTFLAHAEMNAFATMERFKADGLHLYTTLEPCLMCAATAVLMHTKHIHFAAADELFSGVERLWDQHSYATRFNAKRSGPLGTELATFARVVPLTLSAANARHKKVMLVAQAEVPQVAALAIELVDDKTLETLRNVGATAEEAIADLWPRLS